MSVHILIADDHALVRRGLQVLIEGEAGFEVMGEADSSEETLRLARELQPDILLLDISMPGRGGIEITRQLHLSQPDLRILILTAHEDDSLVREAFSAGAMGYIVKRAADAELINALKSLSRGDLYVHPSMTSALLQTLTPPPSLLDDSGQVESLTPRELDVLRRLAHGYTNRQMAEDLNISIRTVEGHRANLMGKLGLTSRLDLVEYAKKHSLL